MHDDTDVPDFPSIVACHFLDLEPEELKNSSCKMCREPLLVLNVAWESGERAVGIEQAGYCTYCDAVHMEGPPWPSQRAS
jgi:hypothetical protein